MHLISNGRRERRERGREGEGGREEFPFSPSL
jgi:hypothetical protein